MKETEIAIQAAKEAGQMLLTFFRDPESNHVRRKADGSLVSDADMKSNELIIATLQKAFPDYHILSEESHDKQLTDAPTFVIDPIDGTKNFVYGMPLFGVMIAFADKGETLAGIMYDPVMDELFVAEKGKGATANGKPIHVSERELDAPGILFAGRGSAEKDPRHAKIMFELEQETPYFRRFGSAITMLSAVACGRADAVILTGSAKPWDVLPGALIVQEAGGMITDYCGKEWKSADQDMVATNGKLHHNIIEITKQIEETNC